MGPPGPLRKDGCPDMRYSCNRSWASSSGSSVPLTTGGFYSSGASRKSGSSLQLRAVAENAPARLRADGLPDMRFSANKRFVAERNLSIPLTTTSKTSKNNTLNSDKPISSSDQDSAKTPTPFSPSYTSTSYSDYFEPPCPSVRPGPERERSSETSDGQGNVIALLEETLRVMELKQKIQDIEKSLRESKAKEAIPHGANTTTSDANFIGTRNQVSTTEGNPSIYPRIVPLTNTSKKNSLAPSKPTKSSESAKTSLPSSSSYSSTSYSNYYAPPVYVPIPVPVLAQSSQPERKRNSNVQDNVVTQLEETLSVMELKQKIQDLEKSLKESKAKEAIPASAKSSVSSAISTGARSRVSTTEKSHSTFSRIETEMARLQDELGTTIASTQAVMVSRQHVVKITDNFRLPIGRGGFSQVFKGTWNKQQVAVKEICCSAVREKRSFSKMIRREVEALSVLQHPNIIKLLGVCAENEWDDGTGSIGVSLIFDFADGGTLFDCLFGSNGNTIILDIQQIMLIARHLIEALHLLHSTSQEPRGTVMVHRDVKSANVLLYCDGKGTVTRAVLADFGLARFHYDLNEKMYSKECGRLGLAASSMTAVVGTHGYVDPLYAETSQVAPSQDVYAYGVVLYEMLWRERPETMLARRVRQSQIEECMVKSESNIVDKGSALARTDLPKLVKIGKRCVGMKQRLSSAEIRKLLEA